MTYAHDKTRAERWSRADRLSAAQEGVVKALEEALGYLPPGDDPALHKFWQKWIPSAGAALAELEEPLA